PREGRPRELLAYYGRLQGLDARTAAAEADRMLAQVHLTDRARSAARTLSHGMRKRIMIAQCFLGAPEVVLLDEPLSGLDPREVAHMRDFIVGQRKRRTIVISSHNLHEIELLCDHVAFVEKGRTVRSGPIDTITGSRGLLVYTLGAGALPPEDALEAAVPGASFAFDAEEGTLTCRFDADRATPDAVNALVLRLLLDAAIPILAVTQGARLESEYLRHSA
ncbi:MAG: ABC transporter ATP-binding protein, partial [Verrucomicrobia bacterium]|nr:ABC transporter ATP-binding protein [Verrucomicrobiota bacterium]